ncbi:MAG: Ig-like domain-containing protein [Acidobacteriaceae bacterium]|jgi:uncharacterized protein YjdB
MKTQSFGPSALVSPRVLLGVGLVLSLSLFGGTGCSLSYSLTGLTVEPATGDTCLIPGVSAQFKAYGTYTEGGHTSETRDITDQVTWSATIPAVATVNSSGLVTGAGDGTTSILAETAAEFGTVTAVSNVVVESPGCTGFSPAIAKPFSLSIIPGNQNLTAVGQSARLLAIATYGAGERTADLSRQATWESSDAKVATIDASGLLVAVGPGDAVITATAKAASGEVVSARQTVHLPANSQ